MSPSQKHLWDLCGTVPGCRAHNEVVVIAKEGAVDCEALRRALSEVVARHEAWRTTFRDIGGELHQVVNEPQDVDLPVTDLSHLGHGEARRHAADIAAADAARHYDLARGPLIRPRLVRFSDDRHRLYLCLHRLIFDSTTLQHVIVPELLALYRSFTEGTAAPRVGAQAQYADYTAWELDWVDQPDTSARIDRWRGRLDGVTPIQLPSDHPRPAQRVFSGGSIALMVDQATVEGLRRAAHGAGGALVDGFAAAFAWWLHLHTGSEDTVFGSLHDLRQLSALPTVAGHCVTPLVLRCSVHPDDSFCSLLDRIRKATIDAACDVVPFASLAALDLPRDPRTHPLFQAALSFQPSRTPSADWSLDVTECTVHDAVGCSTLDISIELDLRPEGHVLGRLVFDTDLFDRATALQMMSTFYAVLSAVAAAPLRPLAEHDLVTDEERRRQLNWNSRTAADGPSRCVHDVIRAQAERTPDAVAVQAAGKSLTYRQLDERAAAIASRLSELGAAPGGVVALLLERTPDLIAAILGVLKAGAAFLPLDPRQPAARTMFSVNDAGAGIIVTDRDVAAEGEPVSATVVDLRDDQPVAAAAPETVTVTATDLAYVIYTSGSTGRPKGVLIEHAGVTNLMDTMYREFGIGATDTTLAVSSVSFDVALGDIFCTLSCGARLVLASPEEAGDPAALKRLIDDSGATYMMATPTTWNALVTSGWEGSPRLTAASIGEALPDRLAEALLERCESVWNTYGPTEATIITSVVRLTPGDTVTVGTPLPNVRHYVVDAGGRLQPVGVPGEIAIGGVAVARGYRNRPDENARRFVEDPYNEGGRMYRTGDRGRFLADGRLQHLGRYDEQLKIRGFRIEPGEIEATLCEDPRVKACAVVARTAPNGEQQLVAYLVGELADAQARDWLRRRLPEYMVPGVFVRLDALPTTASGKVNKAALPSPPHRATDTRVRRSRTESEELVAALWERLLGHPVVDDDADFFDSGGHSLLAARLIAAIEETFGLPMSLPAFLDSGRTIAGIAAALDAEGVDPPKRESDCAPVHFVFADVPSAMSLRHFTALWGTAQPIHAVFPNRPVGGFFDQTQTIEMRAARILTQIRERQPYGPISIVGYSFGGILAYDAARQAVQAGERIDWLCVLDTPAPPVAHWERAQFRPRARIARLRASSAREQWSKSFEVALRVLHHGRQGLWPADDFDYRGAIQMTCDYRLPGHGVPMDLVVTDASAKNVPVTNLGWDGYHRGKLHLHRLVNGDHWNLLEKPHIDELARTMLDSLRQAKAAS